MKGLIRTVTGDVPTETLGVTLVHEHLYTDLRPLRGREEAPVPTDEVLAATVPLLVEARRAGLTALVECTPPGTGRQPELYRRISQESGVLVVAATGLYKEPLLPQIAYDWSVEKLADWMISEIEVGMLGSLGTARTEEAEGEPVRAGLVKLASSDAGLQGVEAKTLRAALRASAATGAPIASHSPSSDAALAQIDILEREGGDPARFVVVHANAEPDFERHLEMARRGVYVEYDAIGSAPDEQMVGLTVRLVEAGYARQLLLSQDVCGWLVGRPPNDRRYAYLLTDFLPTLREAGVSEAEIGAILVENPRRLLAL